MRRFLDGTVLALSGDITRQKVDAIVNAANSSLLGSGGVDGAIHSAGGPAILSACEELRRTVLLSGLPAGDAVITPGGELPARFVIHTVGPVYGSHSGNEAALLTSCYRRSLFLAAEHGLSSIAFPAISTGVYGYPRSEAAAVSSRAIASALAELQGIREVRLVFFSSQDLAAFLEHHAFAGP